MNKSNLNREWDFIVQEINAGNKGGTWKWKTLFEFQILLAAISKTNNSKERRMLASIFEDRKRQYVGAGT